MSGCVGDVLLRRSRVVRGPWRERGWALGVTNIHGDTIVRRRRVSSGAVWRRGGQRAFPARCRGRRILKGVFRRWRGVDPYSEVRVGFPAKVVEVVGLGEQGGSDCRADWEALRGDARPESCKRDLSSHVIFLVSSSSSAQGRGDAVSELFSAMCVTRGEGSARLA